MPDIRHGFTGHLHDDDLGLINMRGRMFDPSTRRFLTPDPLGRLGANPFSYVLNNPLNWIDPSGFTEESPDGSWFSGLADLFGSAPIAAVNVSPDLISQAEAALAAMEFPQGNDAPTSSGCPNGTGTAPRPCAAPGQAGCVPPGTAFLLPDDTVVFLGDDGTILEPHQFMGPWVGSSSGHPSFEAALESHELTRARLGQGRMVLTLVNPLVMGTLQTTAGALLAEPEIAGEGAALTVLGAIAIAPISVPAGALLAKAAPRVVVAAGEGAAAEIPFIYRGVHAGHPEYDVAARGIVLPGNPAGNVTAEAHNLGGVAADSPFTSWTHSLDVARFHATKDGPGGLILRVPQGAPEPGATWRWEWSPDVWGEQEVLLWGTRRGVEVIQP
jgi:RHS repeat-associated protein